MWTMICMAILILNLYKIWEVRDRRPPDTSLRVSRMKKIDIPWSLPSRMFDDVAALSRDRIREIRTEWAKQFLEIFGQILESVGAHSQQPYTDLRTLDDHHVTHVRTKGSCANDVSGPSGGKTPPVDTGQFRFYADERPPRLVAIGRVHHGDFTPHCAPLPAHLVKVVVEEAVDGSAEVPIPTEEVSLVREALGTFIVWPKNLVVADFIKRYGATEPPKKHARQEDRSSHSDTLKELFSVAANLFTDPLQVPWDTSFFRCGGDDVPLYISYNDLLEIIQDKQ
ncbi:hypothetical protein OROMI_016263 [Orobanche minor]